MFDQETKREKIIEAKIREQKLKNRSMGHTDVKNKQDKLAEDEARLIKEMEQENIKLIGIIVSHLLIFKTVMI